MSVNRSCPKCGDSLLDDAPEGICPRCLLQAGLLADSKDDPLQDLEPTSAAGTDFVPPSPEELGKLFPQLEIIKLLGRGGMGAVYFARQPALDRPVALKILPPEFNSDSAFSQRFTREARALAKLNHQNIVSVFDFGQAKGQFYFIMEYVDGSNLRHLMESNAISSAEALTIVHQICEALQFAHKEGVVHRDVKPENILVDKNGIVKIADFGLAKLVGGKSNDATLTGTEQIMGTFRYMAPEQMVGTKDVDHRADIFSLGVIFYELLTGELPVGRFDPPSTVCQSDARLDEVVLRALEKEPDRRYQQASEVNVDLKTISETAQNSNQQEQRMHMNMNEKNPMKADEKLHSSPYGVEEGSISKVNYGLLTLGGMMITLGMTLLGYSLITPNRLAPMNQVFFWIGLGLSLGGGGLISITFAESNRLPGDTKANFGALFGGLFMSFIGFGILLARFIASDGNWLNPNDVLIWIGIGLFIGGGGVCAAAWIPEKKSSVEK